MKKTALYRAFIVIAIYWLAACGGGGGGGGGSGATAPPPAATNMVSIVVDGGPPGAGAFNLPYISLTICTPGTTQCQTIDHVLVDTGSVGLRLISSALSASVNLPVVTSGASNILECTQFAGGYSWGPLKIADLKIGNQVVAALPIQVIGDPIYPNPPASCSNLGNSLNSVAAVGANGVLGVGVHAEDCGPACAQAASNGVYFSCSGSCQPITRDLSQQVPNPVVRFSGDNNGVLIDLPDVPASGATTVNGSLIFGIGTQANNNLGNARLLNLNSLGEFTTLYNGNTLTRSFIDSGSNGFFFPDNGIPLCSPGVSGADFYCPSSTLTLSAIQQSAVDGSNVAINFSVVNATAQFSNNPTHAAYNNIGGTLGTKLLSSFDWGSPFFFGRRVFTAIEGRDTPSGPGPYVAY
ncbi:MAG TPA: DUF3443 domain-containing protein [Spongiibacteraceae bacterium]|nr:DUF3443 domain-containing protein [Spongiibacteraceae bacterium]